MATPFRQRQALIDSAFVDRVSAPSDTRRRRQ
jgi:hypothetical protein